jgi:hypothetical protein
MNLEGAEEGEREREKEQKKKEFELMISPLFALI